MNEPIARPNCKHWQAIASGSAFTTTSDPAATLRALTTCIDCEAEAVRQELGLHEGDGVETIQRVRELWGVVAAARYLIRWWDDPQRHDAKQGPYITEFIAAQEKRLRAAVEVIDGPPSQPSSTGETK